MRGLGGGKTNDTSNAFGVFFFAGRTLDAMLYRRREENSRARSNSAGEMHKYTFE